MRICWQTIADAGALNPPVYTQLAHQIPDFEFNINGAVPWSIIALRRGVEVIYLRLSWIAQELIYPRL